MRYFWGLLLVLLGGSYLAASLEYISYEQINQLWLWWPLVLIFIGVDLLFRKFKYGWLGMIVLTLLAGLAVYDVSFAPRSYLSPNKSYRSTREVQTAEVVVERDAEVEESTVDVKTGAIEFDILGNTDKLIEGVLESNVSILDLSNKINKNDQSVRIATEPKTKTMMWFGGGIKNKLKLAFSEKVPLNIRVASGASSLDFDLEKYIISGLKIEAGASAIKVRLGELIQNGALVEIGAGASTIELELPKEVGVRIKTESGLTTKNFEGFSINGEYAENEAFKTAGKKIEVVLKAGASTINIKQY